VRHEFIATELTFWIAHGPSLDNGILTAGQVLATGEDFLETFTSYIEYINRWVELGGKPEDAPPYEG